MDNGKYIGLTDHRLHHIYGVAKKAYSLAKERGHNEDFAIRCFMLGWIHDVGYEFSEVPKGHAAISAQMYLRLLDDTTTNDLKSISYQAIKGHVHYTDNPTEEWKILNMADMLIDSDGTEVTVTKRLEGIKERYGEHSDQYLTACDICCQIGLTVVNLAGNIT